MYLGIDREDSFDPVILPEIDYGRIAGAHQAAVRGAVQRVLDSAFRGSPTSVVDHCRAALTVLLSRWLVQNGHDECVLGPPAAAGPGAAAATRFFCLRSTSLNSLRSPSFHWERVRSTLSIGIVLWRSGTTVNP